MPTLGAAQHGQCVEHAGFETSLALEVCNQLLLEYGNRRGVAGFPNPVDGGDGYSWIGVSHQTYVDGLQVQQNVSRDLCAHVDEKRDYRGPSTSNNLPP